MDMRQAVEAMLDVLEGVDVEVAANAAAYVFADCIVQGEADVEDCVAGLRQYITEVELGWANHNGEILA